LILSKGCWQNPKLATPTEFSASQRNHLQQIEQSHFWFGPRDSLLVHLAQKKTIIGANMLEIGCGTGRMLNHWNNIYQSVTAIEPNLQLLLQATNRNSSGITIHADSGALPFPAKSFASILCFDVLEHVDDIRLLHEARRVSRKGGRILLSAPAFQSLWSYADQLAGHKRRYRKQTLLPLLSESGWQLQGHTYYQCLLFPLVYVSRKIVGKRGRKAERNPSKLTIKFFRKINQLEAKWSKRHPLPFGSSIIIWAKAI
jgi:SAM-dependent methyltransferase